MSEAPARGVERIRWWRPPGLPGAEVLECDHCDKLWKVYHETFTVCSMLDVTSRWIYRGRERVTPKGGLMLMEPGEVHVTRQVWGPGRYRVLLLPAAEVAEAAWDLGSGRGAPHLARADLNLPPVSRAFARLHENLEGSGTLLERQSLYAECLRLLLEHAAEGRPRPDADASRNGIRAARDFLRERSADNVSLDELSRVAGMSRFHLLRRFRREVGVPPHTFQIQMRVAQARRLLARGVPLATAAGQAGFYDQSHMTLHFRRILGVTPRQLAAGAPAFRPRIR